MQSRFNLLKIHSREFLRGRRKNEGRKPRVPPGCGGVGGGRRRGSAGTGAGALQFAPSDLQSSPESQPSSQSRLRIQISQPLRTPSSRAGADLASPSRPPHCPGRSLPGLTPRGLRRFQLPGQPRGLGPPLSLPRVRMSPLSCTVGLGSLTPDNTEHASRALE